LAFFLLVEYQVIVIADNRKMPRVPAAFERGGEGKGKLKATIAVS